MNAFETALANHIHDLRAQVEDLTKIAHASEVFEQLRALKKKNEALRKDVDTQKKRAELWKQRAEQAERDRQLPGVCSGCGRDLRLRTAGCVNCTKRHEKRERALRAAKSLSTSPPRSGLAARNAFNGKDRNA